MKKETSVFIESDIVKPSPFMRLLLALGWAQKVKRIELRPFTLATSKVLIEQLQAANVDVFASQVTPDSLLPVAEQQRTAVAKLIATAIKNRGARYSNSTLSFIQKNMDAEDLANLLYLVRKRINTHDLIDSVYLLKTLGRSAETD